ncbi:MAG: SRPBCC domain-containing protein [Patescibacteria group bacterium]
MDITIERVFDAPVEKVWKAWTEPEEIMKWWGPKNWTAPVVKTDFKVGGTFLYCMRGTMGPGIPEQDNWSGGEYKEIVPLQKIVATDYFTDPEGNKISSNDVGMPGKWPDEMRVTATFEDMGGKTKLTLFHEGHPAEIAEMAKMGWNQSLDKLAAIL